MIAMRNLFGTGAACFDIYKFIVEEIEQKIELYKHLVGYRTSRRTASASRIENILTEVSMLLS